MEFSKSTDVDNVIFSETLVLHEKCIFGTNTGDIINYPVQKGKSAKLRAKITYFYMRDNDIEKGSTYQALVPYLCTCKCSLVLEETAAHTKSQCTAILKRRHSAAAVDKVRSAGAMQHSSDVYSVVFSNCCSFAFGTLFEIFIFCPKIPI